jgi:hypothetical protein
VRASSSSANAALRRVACIEELLPQEAVVIADPAGGILAATRAARRRLRLLPEAFDHHVSSLFEAADIAGAMEAFRRAAQGVPVEFRAGGRGAGGDAAPLLWTFAACDGGVSLRAVDAPPPGVTGKPAETTGPAAAAKMPPGPVCDLGEAIGFAVRHARRQAEKRGASLSVDVEESILVACDRQTGRRIVGAAIEAALAACTAGSVVRVDARRVRGIVLARVAGEDARRAADAEDRPGDASRIAALRMIVEAAGGTLIVDDGIDGRVLSIRLGLADAETTKRQAGDHGEAR